MSALPDSPLWRPLTLHDAALINALGAAIVPPVPDPQQQEDAIRMVGDLLPLVSRDHVLMRDLAAAGDALVAAWPERGRRAGPSEINLWARALFDAGMALGAVMRVRAAAAFVKAVEGVAR